MHHFAVDYRTARKVLRKRSAVCPLSLCLCSSLWSPISGDGCYLLVAETMVGETRRSSVSLIPECPLHSRLYSCPWAQDCVSQHACFRKSHGAHYCHASSIPHVPRVYSKTQTSKKPPRLTSKVPVLNQPFSSWICKGGYGWNPHDVWSKYMSQVWKESLCTASVAAWPPWIHHFVLHSRALEMRLWSCEIATGVLPGGLQL